MRRLTDGAAPAPRSAAPPDGSRAAGGQLQAAPPPFEGGTLRTSGGVLAVPGPAPSGPAPSGMAPSGMAPSAPAPSEGGAARALANGAPALQPDAALSAPPAAPPPLRLSSFRDVAMLVADRREPLLHGALLHQVHLVRFAPPVIELRPTADAPRNLAPRLAALLLDATGARWTIALSRDAGDPTLHDQGEAADQARRGVVADHPLVRAILDAFPGAKIHSVTDSRADAYGLVDAAPILGGDEGGDGREFAPLDAEDAGEEHRAMMEDGS